MISIIPIEEENRIRIGILILRIEMLPILLFTATAATTTVTTPTNLVDPRVRNIVHGRILCLHIVNKVLYYASTILIGMVLVVVMDRGGDGPYSPWCRAEYGCSDRQIRSRTRSRLVTRLPIIILSVIRTMGVSFVIADEQGITLHPRGGSIPRRP